MTQRKNPETSIAAYHSLDKDELAEVYQKILSALSSMPEGGTFEEVSAVAKIHPSQGHRRLPDLLKKDLVYRPGDKRPLRSGRAGFVWKIVEPPKEDTGSPTWKQEGLF